MGRGLPEVRSVNAGRVETLAWRDREYRTAIVKRPLEGRVEVDASGLVADTQGDRRVHGGADKAVYLYPREHYPFWEEFLDRPLSPGALGENLTTTGILEEEWAVGDVMEAGGVRLQVAEPRLPCATLSALYRREDLVRRFVEAARPGIYLRVLGAGSLAAGDSIRSVDRARERWSVTRVFRLRTGGREAPGVAVRLAGLDTLGCGARDSLAHDTGFHGTIRPAREEELPAMTSLLEGAGLPLGGFPGHTPVVMVAVGRGGEGGAPGGNGPLLGGVALELHGEAALLRSAVVREEGRGQGLGAGLVQAALARAWEAGATSVALLTETAPRFFQGMGFRPVARGDLPAALHASRELQDLCPASAAAFLMERPERA